MKISNDIVKSASENRIAIQFLTTDQAKKIRSNIAQKYLKSAKNIFMWEGFGQPAIASNVNGWKLICDFVREQSCLLLLDACDDESIFVINSGNDLYTLLSEMYGFEFYITNMETEYILCFNHHDCLIGCGTAKRWVESLS